MVREVQEKDLSKDLFGGEAQLRTLNKLMFLDTYLIKLQQAIDSKNEQEIEENKAKALSNKKDISKTDLRKINYNNINCFFKAKKC